MFKIINADLPITREEVGREEMTRRILAQEEPFKLEILEGIPDEPGKPITVYHMGRPPAAEEASDRVGEPLGGDAMDRRVGGDAGTEVAAAAVVEARARREKKKAKYWWDLCAGPHLTSTGELNAKGIDLETIAGAYWRGDENLPMLTRIYGTAWETAEDLAEYKRVKEEAQRRDHRRLGKALRLFSLQEEAGGGLVFWHPRGAVLRRLVEDAWKEAHLRAGYELVYTPHIARANLWDRSGHSAFYADGMFEPMAVEGEEDPYRLRPMNCPFHVLMYRDTPRSYRDLPLRWAELGTVYRYERSGTLHGLMRVRGFTQDDAHIFCADADEDQGRTGGGGPRDGMVRGQLMGEIVRVLDLVEEILGLFGFDDFEVCLSTRPKESVGSDEIWARATAALEQALEAKGWSYEVEDGDGAFYGPKIDVRIRDAIGRVWQCSTVQCDFNLPERFDLTYKDSTGAMRRPIMVHRAIFGSLERFLGILIEDCAGDFPLWLAPEQLRLLPVTERAVDFCAQVAADACATGLRATVDHSEERLGKDRDAWPNVANARLPTVFGALAVVESIMPVLNIALRATVRMVSAFGVGASPRNISPPPRLRRAKMVRNGTHDRVPLLAIVGDVEVADGTLSLRARRGLDLGQRTVADTMAIIHNAVVTRTDDAIVPLGQPDGVGREDQ